MSKYLLSIDQGTTSTRAMLFTESGAVVAKEQMEFPQHFPKPGWVEHDPEDLWRTSLTTSRKVLQKLPTTISDVVAIGITNQRETTLIWNKITGEPLYNAIVWQDRRTTALCQQWSRELDSQKIQQKTGLILDPYFSASKIRWLLDQFPDARRLADKGDLAFGTVDSYLVWRLTEGHDHVTDVTNASRTLLFNIHTQQWDLELLDWFGIPKSILPRVMPNTGLFGITPKAVLGAEIPITGMAGDQHAALIGQGCLREGLAKSTYGTGCFLMVNTGKQALTSSHHLLTTLGYSIEGQVAYAVEGSIFIAGAVIQWLKEKAKMLNDAKDSSKIASQVPDNAGVYFVPAFTGLGAPYWDPDARGAIIGLTRDTGYEHIVRAALESICYQTRDLLEAMAGDGLRGLNRLRVDGGMVENAWLMQMLSDLLQLPIDCAKTQETTALGAALLAGIGAKLFSFSDLEKMWSSSSTFQPQITATEATQQYRQWQQAVNRVLVRT